MTLEDAINHSLYVAEEQRNNGCIKCAEEHMQLAKWLVDYESLKEKATPVIPKDFTPLCTGSILGRCPECGFGAMFIKGDDEQESVYATKDKLNYCVSCGQALDWGIEE